MASNTLIDMLRKCYHRLPSPPSMNYMYRDLAKNPYDRLSDDAVIYDIGSKARRGRYPFGSPKPGMHFVCVDIEPDSNVDLVADAHDMHMVEDNSVDFVISSSTLEHVHNPRRVMHEIWRILKPGGMVYINVPFVFRYHSDPDDFYRFSYKGLELLCEDFEILESGFSRGPASTMSDLLPYFFAILFSFNNKVIYGVLIDVFKWLLFWIKYLDYFIGKYDMAHIIHTGCYFLGRKVIPVGSRE